MRAKLNGTEIYFDVDGAALEITESGLAGRPTLIALHGGPGFDHGYLRPGLGPLRAYTQVVYPDLRGQGRSGRPDIESCTLEQMADDVAALCDVLGIEHPIVFGHSFGGFVAMHLAIRHPELASGLILCHTAPTLTPLADTEPTPTLSTRAGPDVVAVAERLFGGDLSPEVLKAFGEQVTPFYAAPSHMDVPGRLLSLSIMTSDVTKHFFGKLAATYDLRAKLGSIAAPTLVVVGAHDWVCSPAAGRAIARGIPGAKLTELADAGHFGFSEEPDRFLEAVASFVSEVAKR